jgi:signal transduction histidine kinase
LNIVQDTALTQHTASGSAELETQRRQLEVAFQQVPAAVIVAEAPSGRIISDNAHLERMLRRPVPRPQAIGEYVEWRGMRRDDGRPYRAEEYPLARAITTGETVTEEEIDYVRGDGSRGTMSVNAAPVKDATGQIVAGVAVLTDVSEQRQGERERASLLSAISHDLRNPLTAIKGTVQILQRQAARGNLDPARLQTRLAAVDEAAGRMAAQLAQLSDLARLRAGQPLVLDRRPTDLADLARRVVAAHEQGTDDHRITFQPAEPHVAGNWDSVRLERVVDNLLSNAIKYSPNGGTIVVSVGRDGQDAVLRVEDHGIGIPAADLPRIFVPFIRGTNVDHIPGTGAGLAAVQQIVAQHGGGVSAASTEGEGSTFTVRLPL